MMRTRRAPLAPAAALAAGAALYLLMPPTAARAGELDAPMQPIARNASTPPKLGALPAADAGADSDPIRNADRMGPEYPGDPEMMDTSTSMDALVDRTVDAVESVGSATATLLRRDRP